MLNKQKSHVMYQLIAGIKYPRKQAGILSYHITLIAPGLQSHRVTVCFNFYWVCLAAPSPLSPSALIFCPAPNNSSLTYYQTTFVTPFLSLKCICQMDKPPFHCRGCPTLLGPFLICPPETASVPGHSGVTLHGQSRKPLSQPLLQMEPVAFICNVESLTYWGMERNYELIVHTIKDGNNFREPLIRDHLLSAAP